MRFRVFLGAALLVACEVTGKQGPGVADRKAEAHAEPVEADPAVAKPPKAEPAAKLEPTAKAEPKVGAPPKSPPPGARAKLLDGAPIPISEMIGKPPAEAQKKLGEPTGKGMSRESCVRFTPKRVWFECKYAYQRYEDVSGTYKAIQMTYEDGVATGIGFEGVKGEGAFDPEAALRVVGLKLAGEPTYQKPKDNVQTWTWSNDGSRLVLDDKQFRVTVSTVDGQWEHSLVEIMINHPLTDEQKAKIKPTGKKPRGNPASPAKKK